MCLIVSCILQSNNCSLCILNTDNHFLLPFNPVGAAGITPPDILLNEMFLKTIIILTVIIPLSLIKNVAGLDKVSVTNVDNKPGVCDKPGVAYVS